MKALFTTLLIVLSIHLGYSAEVISTDKEKIDIEERPKEDPIRDRSIKNVECYLDRFKNTLDINCSNIGFPTIYIVDEYDNIICCHFSGNMSGVITMALPILSGSYRVLIQSSIYSGEGFFFIY